MTKMIETSENTNVYVIGKVTNVEYTVYGIQLTLYPDDTTSKTFDDVFPKRIITGNKELADYLTTFTHMDIEEIPAFVFPCVLYAKPYIKNGQNRAFISYTVDKDFDISSQI